MKKFFFFAAALFAAVSFAACSDDDDENVGGGGEPQTYYVSRIEVSDSYGYHYSFDFEYDEQNRLIIFKESKSNITTQCALNYVGNKLICQGGFNAISYILNDKGYAVQSIDGTRNFEYDSNGYLLQEKYNDKIIGKYTWRNGDIIKMQTSDDYGAYTTTDSYTYYDRINNQNIWMDFIDDDALLDYYFLGQRSKHLVKSIKCDEIRETVNYEYEFDSKGRPVTVYITADKSGDIYYSSVCKLLYK